MRESFDIIAMAIFYGALFGLAVIALAVFAVGFMRCWQIVWEEMRRMSTPARAIALLAVALASMYGVSKPGRVMVDDPYITDAGSFVTNDFVHVAVVGRYAFIPGDTEILIYSRELEQTNAADWVQITRVEEGPYRLAEFPLDIPFPSATSYNFLVAANYIQAPTVHTNVWQIKGFIVPADASPPSPATFAFPNTKTIRKEDQ